MHTRAGLTVLLAALVVSCGPAPRPSPTLPSASVTATPSNGATTTASASGSLATPSLDIHKVPQSQTTPLLDVNTDGHEIIWSRGDKDPSSIGGVPDLFVYVPGATTATLLYSDADRNAQLSPIAVHNGSYAFVELYARPGGGDQGGWRLWYIGAQGQNPTMIDTSEVDPPTFPNVLPQITITNDQLIWTAMHLVGEQAQSLLRSYSTKTKQTTNLLESPADNTVYWFPNADDQGRLVYSTVERTTAAAAPAFHVYYADLTKTPLQPRRLDTDGHATNPFLAGDQVVWRTVTRNVSDWGQLVRFSLTTDSALTIGFQYQPEVQSLSAGNRFVAAWGWDSTDFELYDLASNAPVVVKKYEPTSSTVIVRPVAAGDLVVFIVGDATPWVNGDPGIHLQLCWLDLGPAH